MNDNELNNKQRNFSSFSYKLYKYNVFMYAQIIPCGVVGSPIYAFVNVFQLVFCIFVVVELLLLFQVYFVFCTD